MSLKTRIERLDGDQPRKGVLVFYAVSRWSTEEHDRQLAACRERLGVPKGTKTMALFDTDQPTGTATYISDFPALLRQIAREGRRIGIENSIPREAVR